MSSPSQPSGSSSKGTTFVSASASKADAATTSFGRTTLELEGVRLAHLFRHLPTDQDCVGAPAEVPEHLQLVFHLGAARDEQERPLDLTEQPAQHLELLLQQETRVRRSSCATPTVDAWAR